MYPISVTKDAFDTAKYLLESADIPIGVEMIPAGQQNAIFLLTSMELRSYALEILHKAGVPAKADGAFDVGM